MMIGRRLACGLATLTLLLCILPAAMAARQVLYTAKAVRDCSLRAEANRQSEIVSGINQGDKIEIFEVSPEWAAARYSEKMGYVLRSQITAVTPLDPVNTPPYGVFKHTYIAETAAVTPVLAAPQADAKAYVTLQAGARVSILDITDGWARIPYKRYYAYADTRLFKHLVPVSPTDEPLSSETPIAAFISFYNVDDTKSNIGRMENLRIASQRLNRVIAPGEVLNFNTQIGPFSKANGYEDAPVLKDGDLTLGPGGGTCQVSSTFYNTVLQLPKISILERGPHGPTGAKYLPYGMDAAVGSDIRNLRIRNDYGFAVRVEASSQDGALFMCIYKQ